MTSRQIAGTEVSELEIAVGAVIRRASATAIMPRFRQLEADAIEEKTPGELVTIADRESEAILTNSLAHLLPGGRVVGEEACSAQPSLLTGIDEGIVWIVDPLDGTANFAAGRESFGVIVALAVDGTTEAAWLYLPVHDRLFFAHRGNGATVREACQTVCPVQVSAPASIPVATLATQFMTDELRASVFERAARSFELRPIPRCAAEHYPRLCEGQYDVALFQRTLPWDHAAGALLLCEAGGHVSRWDGTEYCFHDDGLGIIAATSRLLCEHAAKILFSDCRLAGEGQRLQPQRLDIELG